MPKYFFHTESVCIQIDEEGTELADLKAVRAEAIRTAGELLRDAALSGTTDELESGNPWRLWVTDGPGGSGTTHLSIHVVVQDSAPQLLPLDTATPQ